MRIDGPFRAGRPGTAAPRRTGGGGFSLDGTAPAGGSGRTAAARNMSGLEGVLALQEVEDPAGRRKGAVKRGNDMLDLLDELRLSVLSGRIAPDQLERLARLSSENAVPEEGRLGEVLAEIELRAKVELAKLGRFPAT